MIPEQETHELAEEPKSRVRARVGSWVMPVVRILPYLLAALIIIVPLLFATAWDSFLVHYDKIWNAFGDGRVVDGVAGLLQIVLLAIPIAGIILTVALVGRRLGGVVWRWSEGKPVLRAALSSARFGLAIAAVAAVGVALFTWLPNGDRPTTDGRTLKEALDMAGGHVASLIGADSETASAEEGDSEASEPKNLFEILTEPILPQRGEERSTSEPQGSSSEKANESASPSQESDGASSSNPVTLPPRSPVPTVTEAPPMSTEEEPATVPTEEPTTYYEELPVAEEPLPVIETPPATEPPPTAETPPPASEPPPETPPESLPETPPKTPPDASPNANDRSLVPLNCTTSPGEEPGSTNTRCTNG